MKTTTNRVSPGVRYSIIALFALLTAHVASAQFPQFPSTANWPGFPRGNAQAVDAAAGHVFLATRNANLLILDIADPAKPVVASRYPTRNEIGRITVHGSYAYLAEGSAGLSILKVSQPSHPVRLGGYETSDQVNDVAVDGAFAYLAEGYAGLTVLDVRNPEAPVKINALPTGDYALRVAVAGPYAFVASGSDGLQIYDVTVPSLPARVGGINDGSCIFDVRAEGTTLYAAVWGQGLLVIDVSQPAGPALVGRWAHPGMGRALAVCRNRVFMANGYNGLHIIDATVPSAPTGIADIRPGGFAWDVATLGNLVVIASGAEGMHLVDVTQPAEPVVVGVFDTRGSAQGVAASDNYALVADGPGGLRILDVSQASALPLVGVFNPGGHAVDVALSGHQAYVADASLGFLTVDVTSPGTPTWTGSCGIPGKALGLALGDGNLAFVAAAEGGLQIVDVSQPEAPVVIGSAETPGQAQGVAVCGSLAFVATGVSGVQILDVSQPTAPVLIGALQTVGMAYGVTVQNDLAYIADGNAGLVIADVSQPATPLLLGQYDTPGWANAVVVCGNLAYVADSDGGVAVLDVSIPSAPFPVASLVTPGPAAKLAIHQQRLLVAAETDGVQAYQIEEPTMMPALFSLFSIVPPPSILKQPSPRTLSAGQSATFCVTASGDNLTCQWYFNNHPIQGAQDASLTVTEAALADAGLYHVEIKNESGSVCSSAAKLVVLDDLARPSVRILSPAPNARLAGSEGNTIRMEGTARDNARIVRVIYGLNDAPLDNLAEGATNWSATIPLQPGANVVTVKSVDLNGNESAPLRRTVYLDVDLPISLELSGDGAVRLGTAPLENGQPLRVGKKYTVTAQASAQWLFDRWEMGDSEATTTVNTPKLAFTMASNLVLKAVFVPNQLTSVAGTYTGLFHEETAVTLATAGFITVRTDPRRNVTGKLIVDGDQITFSGKLGTDGQAVLPLSRDKLGKSALTLTLALDLNAGSDQLTGTLSGADNDVPWTARLLADRQTYHGYHNPATPFTGNYAFVIPPMDNTGYGYGLVSVSPGGMVTLKGALGDGAPISQTAPLSKNGQWPLFAPLYKETNTVLLDTGATRTNQRYAGALLGWVTFTPNGPVSVFLAPLGTVSWIKNPRPDGRPDAAFHHIADLTSSMIRPTSDRLLPLDDAVLLLGGAPLENIYETAGRITARQEFAPEQTGIPVSLKINSRTGLVSGQFLNPENTNAVTKFYGAALPDHQYGAGSFTSPSSPAGYMLLKQKQEE